VVLDRDERELDLAQQLPARGRELDDVAPPVLGRAAPLHPPGLLELVQQPDEVRAVDLQHAGQVGLRRTAPVAQHGQRHHVPRPDPQRLQRGQRVLAQLPPDLVEQGADAAGRLVEDGKGADPSSLGARANE
jgi:hypothetical protein